MRRIVAPRPFPVDHNGSEIQSVIANRSEGLAL